MVGAAFELQDAFELLGIDAEATELQIRTAYRKRSLQLHPDKVRDVPPEIAADRFHRLTLAYEELMDPSKRSAIAEKLQQERARSARHAAFDQRRRDMTADLEAREAHDKTTRMEHAQYTKQRALKIAELREEGRAMRIDKHAQILREWQARMQEPATTLPRKRAREDSLPPVGDADTNVLLRFPVDQEEQMLQGLGYKDALSTPLAKALSDAYGALVTLHVRPAKNRREIAVVATFADIDNAWRAVEDGSALRCTHALLEECWMGWSDVHGRVRNDAPPLVTYYKKHGISPADASSTLSKTPGDTKIDPVYEADTLVRLRTATNPTP
ncbi:hypothetical protein MVES1_002235 [Malassezia vespertilionis]|uniref:J domain-containing protein n=1 Tax=Malassezia vespertilionis TaxID=2020962 RepID=A0A2N1JC26_9BASI|nr:uncharacterized protein MVES1_002235 [Malassezia vespertilionis]PKI84096.1 hypothetical protein MVES_002109 [Malassezia vespertilionis]WFD06880.1 hypothetical protein MVES1_002235 [Malassezia vespertilionis]